MRAIFLILMRLLSHFPTWNGYWGRRLLLPVIGILLFTLNAKGQELPHKGIFYPETTFTPLDTDYINQLIEKGKGFVHSVPDSAIPFLKESLILSYRSGYTHGVTYSLRYLGEAYINNGQFDSCLALCHQLLDRYRYSSQFMEILPSVYVMLGNISKVKSDYKEAAKYYFESLKYTERFGIKNTGSAYNNLATIFIILKQYQEASFYIEKAQKQARQYENYEILSYALLNKGLLYGVQKQLEDSKQYLDSALTIAEIYGLKQLEYLALAHSGAMYMEKNMPLKALEYLSRTQALKSAVNPDYQVFVWILMGEVYLKLDQPEQARTFLLKALHLAKSKNLNQLPIYARLSDATKRSGLYKEALTYFETYKQLSDEYTSKEVTQNINQLNVKYQTAQKDKELVQNQLLISMQKNQLKNHRLWITVVSACCIILTLGFWIFYRTNKHRQQLGAKNQEINQLKAMLQGEEKERGRIARELHDGIVSQLMAIRLGIQGLKERDSFIIPKELEDIHNQVKDAADDLRRTTHNLIPNNMQEHGLAAAVTLLCEKTEKNTGLEVTLEIFNDIPRYDPDMELSSYRMIQELVQNTVKHAKATSLLVQLSCRDEVLHITVEDDGIGMPEDRPNGSGLKNVMDRIKAMNGIINIESVPKEGTAINIEHHISTVQKNITHAY